MGKIEVIKVSNQELIGVIEALAGEIWREYYTPIIGKEQVCYMLDKFQSKAAISRQIKSGFLYFLIKKDAGCIGYIGAVPRGNELFLSKLYLTSEYRRKGYGRQAIDFIEGLAKEKKCSKITLTVNKNNLDTIKAYQRCGFANTGPVVQDIGNGFVMDDYKMEKAV